MEKPETTSAALPDSDAVPSIHDRRRVPRFMPPSAHALTTRAAWLSILLVAFIAVLTPYNDYVLQNTPLIGNHFPVGVFILMALLVLIINPLLQLLHRPRLNPGELAVIVSMLLIGSAVPSSGLVRYLESGLIGPFRVLDGMPWFKSLAALLPAWAIPTRDWHSLLITNYFLGVDAQRGDTIPILPFLLPAFIWGILIAAIFGCALFLAALFRKQWVQHERLSYPLATIPLELLAAPQENRLFNKLWRNPLLWSGAALPLLVHLMSGLHQLTPGIPNISLSFNVSSSFTETPWNRIPYYLLANRLYLSVIGICFFIPSEVAISLWLFLIINGLARLFVTPGGPLETLEPARGMGIYIAYFLAILYIARRHLWYALQSAWHGTPREDSETASYRTIIVGLVLCATTAWAWLSLAGIQPLVAAVVLTLGLIFVTLMSRIVAETGLFFISASWQIPRFMELLLGPKLVGMGSYYLSSVVSNIFFTDLRETLMPYATNSLRLTADIRSNERSHLLKWFAISLLVSFVVAASTQHYLSYHLGRQIMQDEHAVNVVPVQTMTDAYRFGYLQPEIRPAKAWTHFSIGVIMVVIIMAARLLWIGWPFHPIGLLLMNSWPLQVFWFSILTGWLMKQVLLHYGGAILFRRARPFFIGLIVGEMFAAAFWLLVGFFTNGAVSYQLFPG